MKCVRCNQENAPGAKFCNSCGYPLPTQEPIVQNPPQITIQNSVADVPPKKPWYKKWWIWLIIAVVISVILGLVFGRREDGTSMFEMPLQVETTAKPTEPAERTEPYTVGETYSDDGLEITFVSSGDYNYPDNAAPDKGFKVIEVGLKLKNNDSISRTFGEKYFKCYDDNKPVDIWYSYDEGMHRFSFKDELSPGREFEGFFVF